MLGRWFGRSPKDDGGSAKTDAGPQLCMLAVASARGITASTATAAWTRVFPDIPISVADKEKESVTLESDGVRVVAMAVPLRAPQGDIDAACSRSWMWPEAAASMAFHKGHLIIAATSVGDVVREALAVTRAAAAFCVAGEPTGVYWCSAGVVHEPAMFVEIAQAHRKFGLLPATLWVNTLVSGDTKGLNLTTEGLAALGHLELEIVGAKSMDEKQLRMTAYELAVHVLENGPVLRHGDTFGRDASETWKVEHVFSKFRKGLRVIRVGVP